MPCLQLQQPHVDLDARIVDHGVNPAVGLHHRLGQRLHRLLVGNVAAHRHGLPPGVLYLLHRLVNRSGQTAARLLGTGHHDHLCSLGAAFLGDCLADAPAGAGNNHNFAIKSGHVLLS